MACLLSTVLGLAPAPAGDEAARTLALLRTPERALSFEGPDGAERRRFLLPLLRSYADSLGWKLVLGPTLETALAKAETGLSVTREIARDHVHPLVQNLARKRGLRFRFDLSASEPSLSVELVASEAGKHDFDSPIGSELELLPAWRTHPAFPIAVEIPHAVQGSAELCARLRELLEHSTPHTEVVSTESGALRVTGSSSAIEFVADALRESGLLAASLEKATFPPDPNTPEGRAAAVLPETLRAVFAPQDGPLALHEGETIPSELEIVLEYGRWARLPLCLLPESTRSSLEHTGGGADLPKSVPAAWAHEFISGLLADSLCALTPLPARQPELFAIEKHLPGAAVALDPAGVATVRLEELAAVAHLAATRFQTFVRLPKLEAAQRKQLQELESPDPNAPFWITELDDPQVFSVIGTPRAITSAVLALRLVLAPPKPR